MIYDILVEDARWRDVAFEALAKTACEAVLVHLALGLDFEISLLGCDDARIAGLNETFLGKVGATNVLSWPGEEHVRVPGGKPTAPTMRELGDIAIAYETCAREADEQGKEIRAHVSHLLVHATLHLLGYDHIDDKDGVIMEGLEVEILGKLGVSDPYKDMDG